MRIDETVVLNRKLDASLKCSKSIRGNINSQGIPSLKNNFTQWQVAVKYVQLIFMPSGLYAVHMNMYIYMHGDKKLKDTNCIPILTALTELRLR